jgi:hypothetical protein
VRPGCAEESKGPHKVGSEMNSLNAERERERERERNTFHVSYRASKRTAFMYVIPTNAL